MDQAQQASASGGSMLLKIYAALLIVIGAVLVLGGGQLVTLGGSFYYLLAGIAVIASGVLLWRGDRRGALVYGLMLAATVLWALWEAGFNGWALMPRIVAPVVLGIWLLTPWTRHALGAAPINRNWWIGGAVALVALFAYGKITTGGFETGTPVAGTGSTAPDEWLAWGNSPGGSRYSMADQLNPGNVAKLAVAWTYETHAAPHPGGAAALAFETVPLKKDNTLFICTPHNIVISLDAVSGKQNWRYDPKVSEQGLAFANCRGVAYYKVPDAAPGAACVQRIYETTIDARLIALDALTGKPCADFGKGGEINMREGLTPHPNAIYYATSTPVVSGKVLVTGSYGLDGQTINQPSGVVRGYDLVTGTLVWAFDPAKPDREGPLKPGEVYEPGTPNVWSVPSTDEKLGLVYLPFGVATPDYWGGMRSPETDRFSNALVAVDNATGKMRWMFQVVHHDVWDYDIAAQPVLTTFNKVPAIITVSKTGETFVLDRATGKPLSRVEERAVPQKPAPGDRNSPTQPFSPDMPNFAGPIWTEAMMWGTTPLDQLWCRIEFKKARYDGRFTPPNEDVSIQSPGFGGGVNWGSVSIDEGRRIMMVNSTIMPVRNQLITAGEVKKRGIVPVALATPNSSLESFRKGVPQAGARYGAVNKPFLSPLGVPCVQPPYGLLSAVDLDSRKVIWSRPLGLADRMGPLGHASGIPANMGLPTLGGSVTTKSGLTFIAATPDRRIRAFETATGKLLWSADLPANANAIPMTYVGKDGRQYVVIAAGGSSALASNEKNILVAFAIPPK